MMAVASDLDERDVYQRYIFAGGDQKKWRWATPDRAGTRPGAKQDNSQLARFVQHAVQSGRIPLVKGRAFEIARAQGRRIVFIDQDSKAWTQDGQPTERTMDDFPLPMTYKEENTIN